MKKKLAKIVILALITLIIPIPVLAQTSTNQVVNPNQIILLANPVENGLIIFGTQLGLGSASIPTIVANIIKDVLAFSGIILVLLIIYGGFLWLTSAGDEEQIAKAKSTIINAIIGIIIILTANSIVNFVVSALTTATSPII